MKLPKIHKATKPKPVKKPKKAKPNPLYTKFRKTVLQLEERQRNDKPVVFVRDTESHVCKHCGTEYVGGYCPKCSMPARWQRFNLKLLILNFMDIWGLGNRPMFRTIRDLFWRPGYMIKDYLRGHHLSYFPPFKMLAVWTVILVFLIWLIPHLFGGAAETVTQSVGFEDTINVSEINNHNISSTSKTLFEQLDRVIEYLDDHMLYRIILQNILIVIAVKWAFRKYSDFNYVETFISMIYINCQFLIIAIVEALFTWKVPEMGDFVPYMMELGSLTIPLVLTYDFHQLYDVSWKTALWRTIVATFNLLVLYVIIASIIIAIFSLVEHFSSAADIIPDISRQIQHHVGLEPY